MIIKNQNASQLLLCAICRRQAPRLLDDENLSSTTARLFARSRQAIQVGTGGGPNESRRDRSMAKVFPSHALMLWRSTTSLPWRVRRIYYSSAWRVCGSLFRWSEPTEIAISALSRTDHASQTWMRIKIRTVVNPAQTRRISSIRLWRTTGTSLSTFGSRSKSWCRRRKMRIPANRKTATATLKAMRNAGTPTCSITATNAII
jgi:hypothetical protein